MGKFWSDEECRVFIDLIMPLRNLPEPVGWDELSPIMEAEMKSRGPLRRQYTGNSLFLHWYQRVSERAQARGEVDPCNLPGPRRPQARPPTNAPQRQPKKGYKKNSNLPELYGEKAHSQPHEVIGDDGGLGDIADSTSQDNSRQRQCAKETTTKECQVPNNNKANNDNDSVVGTRLAVDNTFIGLQKNKGARRRDNLLMEDLDEEKVVNQFIKKVREEAQTKGSNFDRASPLSSREGILPTRSIVAPRTDIQSGTSWLRPIQSAAMLNIFENETARRNETRPDTRKPYNTANSREAPALRQNMQTQLLEDPTQSKARTPLPGSRMSHASGVQSRPDDHLPPLQGPGPGRTETWRVPPCISQSQSLVFRGRETNLLASPRTGEIPTRRHHQPPPSNSYSNGN